MERQASPRLGKPPERPSLSRVMAGAVACGANLAMIAGLLWLHVEPGKAKPSPTLLLTNIEIQPKPPGPTADIDPGALQTVELPPVPRVTAPMVTIARTQDTSDLLSESQLAGANRAGEGRAGGERCDTARAVQQVLRRDPRVRAAVANADRLGKASMLWNGDWVRSGGQEGKGLAVVRQAIIWEVAFEPEGCRNERVHGLVLLSLADGRTRFAIGAGDWRWSDLLELRNLR